MSLVFVIVVVVVFLVAMTGVNKLAPQGSARLPAKPTFPYFGKKTLFSAAERSFLGVLEQAAENRYRVFGKVRLADILGVKAGTGGAERQRALNRLLAKHVDFVVCRPADLSIVALVELDDGSHQRPARQARDAFLEQACATANVPLLRFPARSSYLKSEVRAKLVGLEQAPDTPPSLAPPPRSKRPLTP